MPSFLDVYLHPTLIMDERNGNYVPIKDIESCPQLTIFDKPLPCFGCGVGWLFLLLGLVCPLLWYVATVLYVVGYYHRDPRERSGLAACTVAASVCTIAVAIILLLVFL